MSWVRNGGLRELSVEFAGGGGGEGGGGVSRAGSMDFLEMRIMIVISNNMIII